MENYAAIKATRKHIKFVKDNIRMTDAEALGVSREQYRKGIKLSIDISDEVFAFVMNGKAHAIAGYKYDPENERTSVWAVTTPLTDGNAKAVITSGKQFIDSFKGHNLYCCINPKDERVVKLVETLGFSRSVQVSPTRQFFNKE